MGRLKILAAGNSPQAQAQARGRLFEKLMAEVLRHFGYSIDKPSNVNYAGMEIDIEGKSIATSIPLYAECKCYENEVDSPKLQAFLGKFMTMWFKDKRCQGIFIALPGI
ncbi:MAG TPA: restriction endonuclease, partial [Candidatus Methanoperedens sp.]